MTDTSTMAPIHPGEILQVEYLEPLGVTQHRLAVAIGVPPRRINEIVHAKRGITADTALRLARYFGTSERFWLNLQSRYGSRSSENHRFRHTAVLSNLGAVTDPISFGPGPCWTAGAPPASPISTSGS